MELWIRSQDKDYLIKVKSLLVEENDNYNTWQIFGDSRYLGTYKTKERALEVLDDIQELMRSLTDSDLKIIIYKMPESKI